MLHNVATMKANHDRFVSRVAASEVVWSLKDSDVFASCPSNDHEDRGVLMFWSDRAYAVRVKQSSFQEFEPVELTLFDFLFRWLSGMENDRVFAGTNWTGDLAGLEVEPSDLRDQLFDALGVDRVSQYGERLKVELARQNRMQ